ncbi:Ig-like domain-containing protein, partial [Longimicrobium sp.]|uniref:Ig-like domain-containing protein n=1 Tax=Longimicrobium sp. TaxID=2029185 RepID=UPI002ED94A49
DVEANTQSCETPRPEMGAAADVLLGKPFIGYVTTGAATSRADNTNEDTTSMNVAVTNNIGQPIGTTDGTTAAPAGVRVYFPDAPKVTAVNSGAVASATVRLEGTDGTANFSGPEGENPRLGKLYYQYNGVVATSATSSPRQWRFVYSSNTKTFTYVVHVSAPVQYEFGWVTLSPASLALGAAESSAPLSGTPRRFTGETLAEGITWSTSDAAVATVDASTGVVTGVAPGTATITATSKVKAQRKGSIPVTVDAPPTLVSTTPADNATQVASNSNIVLTFSEAVDVTTSSFTLECPTGTAKTFTVSGSGTATVTLDPDADLPAGTICAVKVIGAQVSDSDTNDGPNNLAGGDRTFSFEVNIQAVPDVFGTTATGNVRINSASTSPAFSVTANDQINAANTTVTFAGWNAVAGKTQQGGDVVMTMSGAGMGQFTYNPPAGFEGTDSLEYTVTSGSATASAKVALPVSGMLWFVNSGGAACTTRVEGCGRLTNPYSTLAAFHAENNGTGNNPAANDNIFLYQGADYAGPVTLLAGQKLIGQDATSTLSEITAITPAAGSDALPAMDAAGT